MRQRLRNLAQRYLLFVERLDGVLDQRARAMSGALRCTICAIDYPVIHGKDGYDDCPECGEETDYIQHGEPIDRDEARRIKRHCEFQHWCAEHGRI